jgi:tetratricopeptide (TPR) repeat protein
MRNTMIGLCLLVGATLTQAQQASIDDLRAEFAKGDYRATLQKINDAMGVSAEQDATYDLLMLRAECFVQLKERDLAINCFDAAIKHASDFPRYSMTLANKLIVQRSPMFKFIAPGKEPIDITTLPNRKKAMTLLLQMLAKENKPKVDSALQASTLPPLETAFKALGAQAALEMTTDGKPEDTFLQAKKLAERALGLMQRAIDRNQRRVRQLGMLAMSNGGGFGYNRGLFSQDRDELENIISSLNQIRQRAVEYRAIAIKLGENGERCDAVIGAASDALNDAETLSRQRF